LISKKNFQQFLLPEYFPRSFLIIIKVIILKKNEKMIAPYFPAILVPIVGIFLPGLAMAILFLYIEKESVE
jgi:photosystem I reaction center subunit VIII